jgi:hypothetical protein
MTVNIDNLFLKYKGQSLLVPGEPEDNRGQCVQWVDYALNDSEFGYGMPYHYGNAIDWWYQPGELLDNFDKISDGTTKKGDFVIFNTLVGSQFGHIDLAGEDGSYDSFLGYDSNWNKNLTVHRVQHTNANYVLGVLRLKGGNDMYPNDGDLINFNNYTGWPGHPINDNDKAYWVYGTNNPNWGKADEVWKALLYEVGLYVQKNPPTPAEAKPLPSGLYKVN